MARRSKDTAPVEIKWWQLTRIDPDYRAFVDILKAKGFMKHVGEFYLWKAPSSVKLKTKILQDCQSRWQLRAPIDYKNLSPEEIIGTHTVVRRQALLDSQLHLIIDVSFPIGKIQSQLDKILDAAIFDFNANPVSPTVDTLKKISQIYELRQYENMTLSQAIKRVKKDFPGSSFEERAVKRDLARFRKLLESKKYFEIRFLHLDFVPAPPKTKKKRVRRSLSFLENLKKA